MGDPRGLEQAKKSDALKEGWTARVGTHLVPGVSPYIERACSSSCEAVLFSDKQEGCYKANWSEGYKKGGTDKS